MKRRQAPNMSAPSLLRLPTKFSCTAGALWDLHMSAVSAKGFRRSCLELDAYLKSILQVFDAEGEVFNKIYK